MDKESYVYPINPDDPLFPEKFSVINSLNEIDKRVLDICRDKENLFLFLTTIIISIFLGFFIPSKNLIVILLLLNILVGIIIWRIKSYTKEESKLSRFFHTMKSYGHSIGLDRMMIK